MIAQGVALSALQHAGRAWGAAVWDAVLAAARRDRPAEREAALEIGSRIWRHVDVVSTAAAHAYLDEVTDRGLLSRELMDILLSGRGDTEFAHRFARSLHVRLAEVYVAVLIRGDGVPVEDAAERPLATRVALDHIVAAVRNHLLPTAGSLLLAIRLGDVVALYPLAAPADASRVRLDCEALARALNIEVSIGMSGAHSGLAGLRLAYAEAIEAVKVAIGTGIREHPVALEDVLVDQLLRSSPLGQRILDAALAPLRAYDGVHAGDLIGTLRAYVAADTNVTAAARRLTVHPNTVVYRLRRIRDLTGYDPNRIDELVVLFLGLRLTELRASP
jgi:sugar diacid utilization regulator